MFRGRVLLAMRWPPCPAMLLRPRRLSARFASPSPLQRERFCSVQDEVIAIVALLTELAVVAASGLGTSCVLRAQHAVVCAGRLRGGDVLSRIRVLHAAVAANQAVIAVVSAVWLVRGIGAGFVLMVAAVRAEISIRVIAAVGSIVRVFARLIASVGMIRAVGTVVRMVLRSGRTPCMIDGAVCVPTAVRAVVAIGMVGAVRAIVRVGARRYSRRQGDTCRCWRSTRGSASRPLRWPTDDSRCSCCYSRRGY